MWVLVQMDESGRRKKFVTSYSWENIIKYINRFNNVKKYDDYHYISNDEEIIEFVIQLGECLDRR